MILQKWNGIKDHSTSYEVKLMFVARKRRRKQKLQIKNVKILIFSEHLH